MNKLQLESEEVLDQVKELLHYKGQNYGDTLLNPINAFSDITDPYTGIDLRLDDKVARIRNGEYKEDTWMDIIGYIVRRISIKRILDREKK